MILGEVSYFASEQERKEQEPPRQSILCPEERRSARAFFGVSSAVSVRHEGCKIRFGNVADCSTVPPHSKQQEGVADGPMMTNTARTIECSLST